MVFVLSGCDRRAKEEGRSDEQEPSGNGARGGTTRPGAANMLARLGAFILADTFDPYPKAPPDDLREWVARSYGAEGRVRAMTAHYFLRYDAELLSRKQLCVYSTASEDLIGLLWELEAARGFGCGTVSATPMRKHIDANKRWFALTPVQEALLRANQELLGTYQVEARATEPHMLGRLQAFILADSFEPSPGSLYFRPQVAPRKLWDWVKGSYHGDSRVRAAMAHYFLRYDAELLTRGLLSVDGNEPRDLITLLWRLEAAHGFGAESPGAARMRMHIRDNKEWFALTPTHMKLLRANEEALRAYLEFCQGQSDQPTTGPAE
jgi:hypothetical protein